MLHVLGSLCDPAEVARKKISIITGRRFAPRNVFPALSAALYRAAVECRGEKGASFIGKALSAKECFPALSAALYRAGEYDVIIS